MLSVTLLETLRFSALAGSRGVDILPVGSLVAVVDCRRSFVSAHLCMSGFSSFSLPCSVGCGDHGFNEELGSHGDKRRVEKFASVGNACFFHRWFLKPPTVHLRRACETETKYLYSRGCSNGAKRDFLELTPPKGERVCWGCGACGCSFCHSG